MTDPEDLRRRLYRPDAGPEVLAEYLAAAPQASGEQRDPVRSPGPAPADGSGGSPAHRRRTRTVAIVGATVGALALAGGIVAVRGVAMTPAPAAPSPIATVAAPTPLPTAEVDPATRTVVVQRLQRGGDAGFGAWLRTNEGGDVPTKRFREAHGTGPGVLLLPDAADGAAPARRMAVLLVLEVDGTAGWTVERLDVHRNGTVHHETATGRYGAVRAGVPAVGVVDLGPIGRPDRVDIDAPEGVTWGAAVVLDR